MKAGQAGAVTILESDTVVGGISQTVERDGWRFDIGGHRFFTKVARRRRAVVRDPRARDEAPDRPRQSRILYRASSTTTRSCR